MEKEEVSVSASHRKGFPGFSRHLKSCWCTLHCLQVSQQELQSLFHTRRKTRTKAGMGFTEQNKMM